jgi:hypothetical protein
MDHMAKYKVTGKYEVGGSAPGETVELDPDKVNVDELLRVGLVEPLDQEETSTVQEVQPQDQDATKVDRSGQTRSKAVKSVDQPGTGG